MSVSPFDISWSVAAEPFRFQSPEILTLPGGRTVALSLSAWLALREVLRLLPDDPAVEAPRGEAPPERPGPANRGKAWTDEEEARLVAAWTAGDDVGDIARALGRTRGAASARLVRLGLLEEAEAGLRYPAAAARPARAATAPGETTTG